MNSFITVGNATQPFHRLVRGAIAVANKLPQPVIIQHGNTPVNDHGSCSCFPFEDMEAFICRVRDAELMITHAGAGSLIHGIKAGKIPVVMPRRQKYGELVDDHQMELAEALAGEEKAVIAYEPEDLIQAVHRALDLQATKQDDKERKPPKMLSIIQKVLAEYS